MLSMLKELDFLNTKIWSVGFKGNTILNKNRILKLDLNKQPWKRKKVCENCFRFRCLFSFWTEVCQIYGMLETSLFIEQ